MQNSGKKIVTLFAALFIVVLSFAANKLTVEQRAQKQMEKMDAVCALTAEQQVSVAQFYTTQINKRVAMRAEKEGQSKDVESDVKPLRKASQKEFREGLKAILTPAQFEKWEASKVKK